MRLLIAAMALAAAPAMASDAEIEPDAWRALTQGKTLHYWKDGELYGREYYAPDGKSTVFRFPNGLCAEGQWAYADKQYCFAYGGQLHCFKHIQRGDDIIILGLEDGEEQKVEKIVENEPLSCGEAVKQLMGWPRTDLIDLLGVRHPIIQAPMAGASTPEMAAAAATAGGLGSLGLALKSPDSAAADMAAARGLTNGALNVNFFCHQPPADDPARFASVRERLSPYYTEFDLGEPPAAPSATPPFNEAMLEVVLAAAPSVASFHFGLPSADLMAPLKEAGIIILSSATSPAEARMLEAQGVDAIIAQGWEAGGHRGVFEPTTGPGDIGTFALVPQVVDAVSVPVIAAGGIADARGIAAAFMLGASGVQIGTAFLNAPESMVAEPHKKALLTERTTGVTAAFSGRPARGVVNRYMSEMEGADLPDFPLMNVMTGPLRGASAKEGGGDFMSLWAGQAHSLNREAGTQALLEQLAEEALTLLGG